MASFHWGLTSPHGVVSAPTQRCLPPSSRSTRTVCASATRRDKAFTDDITRRTALLGAALIPVTANVVLPRRAFGDEQVESTLYENAVDGYRLRVPKNWTVAEGAAADGTTATTRGLVVYPDAASARAVNATVVVTPVAPDFTKLGSFGSPLDFGQNMVNSMDRSFLVRSALKKAIPGSVQTAQLVDATVMRGMYYVEYKLQKPEEGRKYLESLVALGNNGRYNRLYTLTLQCSEDEIEKYQPQFNTFLKSFESISA